MCPPAPVSPLAETDEFQTDQGIFLWLLNFKSGVPLPLNVTSDVNPYQHKPSVLPPHLWYLCSGVKEEAECGYWLETDSCEILSNSTILGSRTTLQFHEGRAPNARKTDWVMQEYTITEKCNKNPKDSRALCRVFLADENRPITDIIVTNPIDTGLKTDSNVNNSEHVSKSELLEKTKENNTEPSLVASKTSPDPFCENVSEMDCILRGDYIELNDLNDPGSRSSSSANSSSITMTSEEFFDHMALLREIDDDNTNHDTKDSNINLNITESIKSKEVIVRPATSGSVKSSEKGELSTELTSKVDTSNGASCSSSEGMSREGKRERSKKRKMMKYLCFMAF